MASLAHVSKLRVLALLPLALGCGKLERECRGVSATANAFIAESERPRPAAPTTPEATVKMELATATRYEKLAADLRALAVTSSELSPEVAHYRELAEHSAASLRAVAAALSNNDFETARAKRIELDTAAKGEAPLVHRINTICGSAAPDAAL